MSEEAENKIVVADGESVEELKEKLRAAEEKVGELTEKLAKMEKENSEMKSLPLKGDQQALINEFSKRISAMEAKQLASKKEADQLRRAAAGVPGLRKEIEGLEAELRVKEAKLKTVLAEKETMGQRSHAVESLLNRYKQDNVQKASQIAQLKKEVEENENLKEQVRNLTAKEAKLGETVLSLKGVVAEKEKLQGNLEKVAAERDELRKEVEEMKGKAEDSKKMKDAQDEFEKQLAHNEGIIAQLQQTIQKQTVEMCEKEEEFTREKSDLKKRIVMLENQQQTSGGVGADSAVPLMKEIERLHENMSRQEREFEEQADGMRAKRRQLEEEKAVLEKKVAAVQSEKAAAEKTFNELEKSVADLNGKIAEMEKEHAKTLAELKQNSDTMKLQANSVAELKRRLERSEKERLELDDALKREKEKQALLQDVSSSSPEAMSPFSLSPPRAASPAKNVYIPPLVLPTAHAMESPAKLSHLSSVEKLHSTIAEKEGEINFLKSQITSISSVKSNLEEEVVRLTNKVYELQREVSTKTTQLADKDALQQKLAATNKLVAQKSAMIEEMKLDILDLKESYRFQLQALAEENERVKKTSK